MGLWGRLFRRVQRQDGGLVAEVPNVAEPSEELAPTTAHAPEIQAAQDGERVQLAPPRAVVRRSGVKCMVLPSRRLAVLDLRTIKASRTRIVGSTYWVTDVERSEFGGSNYLLVREPRNKWDADAVAVYGRGRKVGHLSAAKAASFAPIMDALAFDAFEVGGAPVSDNSAKLWVDLPSLPALRSFVKSLAAGERA